MHLVIVHNCLVS